jgi:hypothetical protein
MISWYFNHRQQLQGASGTRYHPEKGKNMTALGNRLIAAAKEADPSTYRIHVPPEIDVKALR